MKNDRIPGGANWKKYLIFFVTCFLSVICCRLFGILETILGAVTADAVFKSARRKHPGKKWPIFAAGAAFLATALVSASIFAVIIEMTGGTL